MNQKRTVEESVGRRNDRPVIVGNQLGKLLEQAEGQVLRIMQEQAAALKNLPMTLEDLVGTLQVCGLSRSMARVESLLGGI